MHPIDFAVARRVEGFVVIKSVNIMASKYFIMFAGMIALSGLRPSNSTAQPGSRVSDTPHNLRKAAQSHTAILNLRDYGDVCIYCHRSKESLLWNRTMPVSFYQVDESPKMAMDHAQQPDSTSLLCLSCHDGTMPLDALKSIPEGFASQKAGAVTIASCSDDCHTGQAAGGEVVFRGANFVSDLRHHHPIGIIYDTSKNAAYNASANGKVNSLPLYGPDFNQVGCATCHDPHDDSIRPFLRMSNENSALCLACHRI